MGIATWIKLIAKKICYISSRFHTYPWCFSLYFCILKKISSLISTSVFIRSFSYENIDEFSMCSLRSLPVNYMIGKNYGDCIFAHVTVASLFHFFLVFSPPIITITSLQSNVYPPNIVVNEGTTRIGEFWSNYCSVTRPTNLSNKSSKKLSDSVHTPNNLGFYK